MLKKTTHLVFQFKVNLAGIAPTIWRRIQVPAKYNFWDLHVAIQDAFGWLDYHLHAFRLPQRYKSKPLEIGVPDNEWDGEPLLPGWKFPLADYFSDPGQTVGYEYDFGDSWEHQILFEAIILADKTISYPQVIAGGRACPPEDCGGVPGYARLQEIVRDPGDPEHEETMAWLDGHLQKFARPYDPDHFDPAAVRFADPKKRWRSAFAESKK